MTVPVWKGDLKTGSFVKQCDVPRELMDVARKFLIEISKREAQGLASPQLQKQEKAVMTKGTAVNFKNGKDISERTNMVFLAGIVQTANIEAERAFFTLDVGMKQWIPCSSYKNEEIIQKLRGLYKGDFIQFKAILKPWSQKKDNGEWDRGMNIEITEVKSIVKGYGQENNKPVMDDDIPF